MTDAREMALIASFMTMGMADAEHEVRKDPSEAGIYEVFGKGGIELHDQLCSYAELSCKLLEVMNDLAGDECLEFPGVFDYEVSEPFGVWYAKHVFEHEDTPEFAVGKDKLIRMVAMFFSQNYPQEDRQFHAGFLYGKLLDGLEVMENWAEAPQQPVQAPQPAQAPEQPVAVEVTTKPLAVERALRIALHALNWLPNTKINTIGMTTYDVANQLEAALKELKS